MSFDQAVLHSLFMEHESVNVLFVCKLRLVTLELAGSIERRVWVDVRDRVWNCGSVTGFQSKLSSSAMNTCLNVREELKRVGTPQMREWHLSANALSRESTADGRSQT